MKEAYIENKYLFTGDFSMTDKITLNTSQEENKIIQTIKSSLLIILTLIFVLLYAAAFSGKLDPLKDNTMLSRLEPIIFVLIGFYFGSLPIQQNEGTLKGEITRQTQKADAAQYAKEKALQEHEMLEEKIKNAKTALKIIVPMKASTNGQLEIKVLQAVFSILDS